MGRRVSVIVATASPGAALAAKSATTTIPIVFQIGVDPVEFGLVASISRPGGNLTGTSFLIQELIAKRLELLHQIVPTVATIGFLVNPTMPGIETQIREAEVAARTLAVSLVVLNATTVSEIEAAFAVLVRQGIGALLAGSDALLFEHSAQVVALGLTTRRGGRRPKSGKHENAVGAAPGGADRLDGDCMSALWTASGREAATRMAERFHNFRVSA